MKKHEMEQFAMRIRCLTSEMLLARGDGHIGGSFSMIEALAAIFGNHMNQNSNSKDWFVLSKGHAGPAYYAVLALMGTIPMDQIKTLNENGTILPSHPDRMKTPGFDCTTGSLGQGISQAVGIAYGLQVQGKSGHVYCIVGDGECNEGEVWEAFQFAAHKRLHNLTIFIDDNEKQVDGFTKDISCHYNFTALGDALGLSVLEINGNDVTEVDNAIKECLNNTETCSLIDMHTVKGYGISYFEEQGNPHHVKFSEEGRKALEEAIHKMRKELGDELDAA